MALVKIRHLFIIIIMGKTQQVKIGHFGSLSSSLLNISGIPPGYVLRPILYILFINNLNNYTC